MRTCASAGVPIAPASIAALTVWMPAPRKVSGAQPTRTPAASAASSTRRAASTLVASGFSV